MMPLVLGLCGLAGSGKSLAADWLRHQGARVIDVDALGHDALRTDTVKEALRNEFGDGIFQDDQSINRTALAMIVFRSDDTLSTLESLVHPWMCASVRSMIQKSSTPTAIDAALLFAMGLDADCDRILLIDAPQAERLKRVRERGWDAAELQRRDARLQRRIDWQAPNAIHLNNSGTKDDFYQQLNTIWKELQHVNQED